MCVRGKLLFNCVQSVLLFHAVFCFSVSHCYSVRQGLAQQHINIILHISDHIAELYDTYVTTQVRITRDQKHGLLLSGCFDAR